MCCFGSVRNFLLLINSGIKRRGKPLPGLGPLPGRPAPLGLRRQRALQCLSARQAGLWVGCAWAQPEMGRDAGDAGICRRPPGSVEHPHLRRGEAGSLAVGV